ncbi:cell division protein FtsZ [Spirochaetia bacterium 38H-sp]|uniref:Cell division protein FtsZ n=1 Tax=Rarispira pelagica TaxID=3141764 RepID=A0ABU9UDC9_9SPIR
MKIKLDDELSLNPTKIKVLGVGGGGCNAVDTMIKESVSGVDFIACNTDIQALSLSEAPFKLPLGKKITKGLGAGGDPEIGRQAAEEDSDKIRAVLESSDMVFITAGMGGGTGTGAAPVIASIAAEMGVLCVGVVTKPFAFEGKKKAKLASEGIKKMREYVDTLIVVPNENLFKTAKQGTKVSEAFEMVDGVLRDAVQGISDLITRPGKINIDFADVKRVMRNKGYALMGTGSASGANRAIDAITSAINNPLLENIQLEKAKGLLINISCSSDFTLKEYADIMDIINTNNNTDDDFEMIIGTSIDSSLGEVVKVTVVAAGFAGSHEDVVDDSKKKPSTAGEYLTLDKWDKVIRGEQEPGERVDLFSGSIDSGNSELDIPAIFRRRSRK